MDVQRILDRMSEGPQVRNTPGGWLAVTSDGSYPRIGVVSTSEEEAVEKYDEERRRWLALRDMPMPPLAEGAA